MQKILAINSGSSSFKFKLFSFPDERILVEGIADRIGLEDSTFTIKLNNGTIHKNKVDISDQQTAVNLLLQKLKKYKIIKNFDEISGIGHRIVAGGEKFTDSAIINKNNLHEIYNLKDYAPLHNPAEAAGIKAFMKILPNVPEVAVFDTSFHQTLDPVHYLYPIPYKYYEKYKARKYGAHGTSIRYVSNRAANILHKDIKDLKLIVCHLGSGASITAVKNGKSYDTSMGFSPLDGIMMANRSGNVDPSLLQFIMNKEKISINQMIEILNHESGLLGISGISPDMRDLKYSPNPKAKLACKMYLNRIIRYIGSYIAEMSGVDAIIFTAGVGEHFLELRADIMKAFKFMGVIPDLRMNKKNGEHIITKPNSKIKFLVVPTNEELMIARDVVRLAHLN